MTAYEFLSRYKLIKKQVRFKAKRIEELKNMSASVSSPGFERSYNPNRNTQAPFIKSIEKIEELREQADAQYAELLTAKSEIEYAIDAVDDFEAREVLQYRYLYDMSWEEIGKHMGMSDRTARRRCDKGIKMISVPDKYCDKQY